jgi:hypothetical protein
MYYVPWRPVRIGTPYERQDREANERLAETLLSRPGADDYAVALDQIGFKIVPQSRWLANERWLMNGDPVLCPQWATGAHDQEIEINAHRHRLDAGKVRS